MQMDERALIDRAVKGDAQAFSELMAAHESRMYAVALRMCAHREDAQDCLQEAMLRVYRSISGFKGQSSFSTWVYRITMNTCLDELRRSKRRKYTSLDERIEAGWSPADDMDTPEHHAMRVEQRRAIERAIALLPEDMRAAVVLRDIQSCPYDEIADILGTNVGTIKSRISRGRARLREILSEQMELFERTDV